VSVWLVLPIKSLRHGKTRLASALDPHERAALLRRLFVHALDRAAEFPGASRTLVATGCPEAEAVARGRGIEALSESAPGLNRALDDARLALRRRGARQMLAVPCDLPELTAADLERLAGEARADRIAIAPDEAGEGTNGLCLPVECPLEFAFGPGSFARHAEAIARLGYRAVPVRSRGLAFDVDLPADLHRWALDARVHT
jgi:2-phospho-L-lactate/phosphoenolpyruvate guanylyltransferase